MRKFLLATVLLPVMYQPAAAQLAVTDNASIALQAKNAAVEIAQLKESFQVATSTLRTLVRTMNPLNLARELVGQDSALGDLGSIAGDVMSMGRETMQVASMVQGLQHMTVNPMAMMGVFMTSGTRHAYQPRLGSGEDAPAVWMDQNTTALARSQTLLMQAMERTQKQAEGVNEIASALGGAENQADITAINARLVVAQAQLQATNNEVVTLTALMQAQARSFDLQNQQIARRSSDEFAASLNGTSSGGGDSSPQHQNVRQVAAMMPTDFSSNGGN